MKRRPARSRKDEEPGPDPVLPPDGAEEHLGYLLKRLQHSIRQAIDERMRVAGVGLSFAHIATLVVISHHPGISGARIAKTAMVTAQTINTILRRLESEGSLARQPHPDNRRVDCWFITDAGRARMLKAKATADPVWDTMLAPLSANEQAQLRALLRRCIDGLERSRLAGEEGPALAARAQAKRPGKSAVLARRKDAAPRGR